MIYETTALISVIDVLIISGVLYALWAFQKHRKSVLIKELRTDFLLIFFGLGLLGFHSLCDLVTMHIIQLGVPFGESSDGSDRMHFYIKLAIVLSGIAFIAKGVASGALRASKVFVKLKESEGHIQQMNFDAVTAFSKLNQRDAQLISQNERFEVALENMSHGLCMFDGQQRLIVCNEIYASMYGLSKDMVTQGTTFRQILEYRVKNNIFTGEDPEKYIEERLSAIVEEAAATKIQYLSDGRVFSISHRPLPGGGWVATHDDISELDKAEATNQRLARIVEDAINEVYVFDAETLKFLQVNTSACRNLGYSQDELYELTPLDLKPEYTDEEFNTLLASLKEGEKEYIRFETIQRRKDGSVYDVDITLQYIRSQNQHVFAAITEDVTKRRKAEAALRQSEELFSKAFHVNTVPFSISGPDGKIFDVNEAWLRTVDYTREEIIGNSSLKLGIWADLNKRAHFVEMLKRDGIFNNYETQYRTKTGELRDMLVSGEWVEVDGEPRMFNISHDVTESKAKQRQLVEDRDHLQKLVNEATADLKAKATQLEVSLAREKELSELQRQFVSMASHEFRTPLAIIDSAAQRLKKRADSISGDDAMKRVDKIRNAVRRMTELMESTLSTARLEEGKIAVHIGPCNVGHVASGVCARLQEITRTHVITCDVTGLPETIRADAGALDQVLTNLLSNAIKYAPDAPDILVESFAEGDDVIIQIRDHGLGIDDEDLPKMFGRFFRAKTSAGITGTGIGLHLVKALVEMHDGSISVESRRGEGSTFIVRLPVAGPVQAVQAA